VDHVGRKVKRVQKVKMDGLVFPVHLVRMHHSFWLHLASQVLKDIRVMLGKFIY
jgi:hypothetical protein